MFDEYFNAVVIIKYFDSYYIGEALGLTTIFSLRHKLYFPFYSTTKEVKKNIND